MEVPANVDFILLKTDLTKGKQLRGEDYNEYIRNSSKI